ncbi:MAG TPA: T9SS type A sorting domain-containing protein [Candidatus Kapabacteria bacterium]|nr:T9SS type A sorting domain-containing protein [Candidatus Kapabacteria bacterium]
MKKLSIFWVLVAALTLTSGLGFAQRGGGFGGGFGFGHGHFGGPPDTSKGGPRDTTIGKGGDKGKPGGGFFNRGNNPVGLSDSCWNVFLSEINSDTATMLKNDLAQIAANRALMDTLMKQARAAWKAKDTAALRAIKVQLGTLGKQNQADWKEIGSILHQYKSILIQVHQACDQDKHHKGPGDGGPAGGAFKMTPVVPNPVATNGQASFTYTIAADSAGTQTPVNITIADAMGNTVKTVFTGTVSAGTYTVQLDLSGLTRGVYILRVQVGNPGIVESQKILIQ